MFMGHLATQPATEIAVETAQPDLAHDEAPKGCPADVKVREATASQTGSSAATMPSFIEQTPAITAKAGVRPSPAPTPAATPSKARLSKEAHLSHVVQTGAAEVATTAPRVAQNATAFATEEIFVP